MPEDRNGAVGDVLISQRFLAEFGGSIRWMYEVFRRWPRPVRVITHDYYQAPPHKPEYPDIPTRPESGDHVTDGETGLVVNGTDQVAVTAALDRLLADGDLHQRGAGRAPACSATRIERTMALVDQQLACATDDRDEQ